jgi:hypothetical protein
MEKRARSRGSDDPRHSHPGNGHEHHQSCHDEPPWPERPTAHPIHPQRAKSIRQLTHQKCRAARELLDVLTRSDIDRATLIGRLNQREDASWLAELLIDIESDPDDITRLELIRALRAVVT